MNITCSCKCAILDISEMDDYYCISLYRTAFYDEQLTSWDKFTKWCKSVWYAITCKDYLLYELLVDKKELEGKINIQ